VTTRRALAVVSALVAAASACARPGPTKTAALPSRPNVLLVTIDTLRADHLGCYGRAGASTPVLDALARRGARFETAIAHVPLTTPSHASILTGLTPLRHGVRDNGDFVLPDGIPSVAEAFRDAGYRTAAFVSAFPLDRRFGLTRGFDVYDDRMPHGGDRRRAAYVERPAAQTTAAARAWVEAGPPSPWFLWVHYFDPHSPYEPPPDLAARFAGRAYDGEIAFVDAQLGTLLAFLDTKRLFAGTLVLVTADHGEALGEHGEETHGVLVYDATLRVPWIMAGPGVPAGAVPTVVARGIDVAPTLLELAGAIPARAAMEGRSLAPALRGQAMSDEPAYAESLFARLRLGWAPLHAWRDARFKLIDAPRPELYALDTDPGEARNRSTQQPDVAEGMRRALRAALSSRPPDAAADPGPDAAERLRALGYLAGTAATPATASLRDPKDGIALVNRLERGIAAVRADPARAVRELRDVLAQDARMALGRRYLALALSNAGDAAGAIREVETLDKAGQAGFEDLLLLADALRMAGRPAEALGVLDRAEKMQPRSPEPALTRARVLTAMGRVADAGVSYNRVLAETPTHAEALRGLGDLALAQGDAAAAAGYYQRILAGDARDVSALVKLGVVRVRAGMTEEGIGLFRQALAIDPGNAEALLDLGGALAKSGRAAEAIPFLERAVATGPRSTVALNSLGFARLETGDTRGALAALRESLRVDPKQTEIRRVAQHMSAGQRRQQR
jgi:arylsulfatase A-like enzyme/tetratricopeptide (TPR) repeat protein